MNKLLPRVYFESIEDAMQCGAVGIRISSEADEADLKSYEESLDSGDKPDLSEDSEPD
ncbi:MAG: hypothetical protein WA957_08720 [Alteraurantiacibacter sp.]